MVDYLLRRGRYDREALAAQARRHLLARRAGCNWKALVALAARHGRRDDVDRRGSTTTRRTSSPISNATHGSDLSWLFGLIVGAVVYYVLAARSVRDEAARSATA